MEKNARKNTKYFRDESVFKNWPSCKGYRLCKMLTLGQKLKFKKTCQNSFYKSFRVVLCKKPLKKTLNVREMRAFLKSSIMQGYRLCKMLTLVQKLKFQKTNPFDKSFRVVLCKKTLKKTLNVREMRAFLKSSIMQGYRLCKILTFGQKLKFQKTCQNPFYKSFRVFLCKKPLQKKLIIREMKAF